MLRSGRAAYAALPLRNTKFHGFYKSFYRIRKVMKTYFRNYRRLGNSVFFLVVGVIFIALGVGAWFFLNLIWSVVLLVGGVLLVSVPQIFIHEKYRIYGEFLKYHSPFPKKVKISDVESIIICSYDGYRRWKGYVKEQFRSRSGELIDVPAILFLKSIDEEELDLCDTRIHARMTYKKEMYFDAVLDFTFLKEFAESGYSGKIYVSEKTDESFGEALRGIFGKENPDYIVYDRVSKKMKKAMSRK